MKSLFMLPCLLPHAIIMGAPCTACVVCSQHQTAARSHRLYLTERTLRLEVDEHDMPRYGPQPCCALLCGQFKVLRFSTTIRLADVEKLEVIEPPPSCGCIVAGVPAMNVMRRGDDQNGGNGMASMMGAAMMNKNVAIAVDSPMDFESFAKLVMHQKSQVDSGYVQDAPPEEVLAASKTAAMPPMLGAMGGLMMQQQMYGGAQGGMNHMQGGTTPQMMHAQQQQMQGGLPGGQMGGQMTPQMMAMMQQQGQTTPQMMAMMQQQGQMTPQMMAMMQQQQQQMGGAGMGGGYGQQPPMGQYGQQMDREIPVAVASATDAPAYNTAYDSNFKGPQM